MTSIDISKLESNDQLIKKNLFAANRVHLPFENNNKWRTLNSNASSDISESSKIHYNLSIDKIEHSTPSKKKIESLPSKEVFTKFKDNSIDPAVKSKIFQLPNNIKCNVTPLFLNSTSAKEHSIRINSDKDKSDERSHSCSSLSLDTFNGQLNVMNSQTSPLNLNSVGILKTSNIFSNLFSSSQLPNQVKNTKLEIKKPLNNFVNDSANLYDELLPNTNNKNTSLYKLSVLNKTTDSFLSNNTSKLFLDELDKLSELDDDENNINKFMKKEQKRYEEINKEMNGTDLRLQSINHFINDVKKQQKRDRLKKRTDRLKDIFKLKTSNFSLNKSGLSNTDNKSKKISEQVKNSPLQGSIEEFDITKSSGFSESSSHYPHTNLSPPSDFIAFHELLDPESNVLEIENAKTNSLNEILENDFLSQNEEPFVLQDKTFENKIKSLKRAGSQKWSQILKSMNNGKSQNIPLQAETGISVNTTVKNFEKQELEVLQSGYAAGIETDIVRKLENENHNEKTKQRKTPPRYVPQYQKNSILNKSNILAEGKSYYSPLKGSESTNSEHKLSNFGRKWWIFGSLGERKHEKVDTSLSKLLSDDADSLVISSYNDQDSAASDDKILELSKGKDSIFRKLTRNFTKRDTIKQRKKSLSVSFVKYTTNIYKTQNEGLEPVTLASEFKAKPILKK